MSAIWEMAARSLVAQSISRLIMARGMGWTWQDVAGEISSGDDSGRVHDGIKIAAVSLIGDKIKAEKHKPESCWSMLRRLRHRQIV